MIVYFYITLELDENWFIRLISDERTKNKIITFYLFKAINVPSKLINGD